MNLWKRVVNDTTTSSRIMKMDKPSLLNWFDTTLMELGGVFDKYRFHDQDFEQVSELVMIILDLHDELEHRENARN